jgi:hypothetical protein
MSGILKSESCPRPMENLRFIVGSSRVVMSKSEIFTMKMNLEVFLSFDILSKIR